MEYFNEGLVTNHDPQTENRNLFYAEYLTLGGVDQGFNSFMNAKKLPNGLYLRSSIHTNRTVSHDEITGWIVSSKILNTNHRFEIWDTLQANKGAYPAVVKDWSDLLPYNPGNYYSWGEMVDATLSVVFYPIYAANLVIACSKEAANTSSKIIYWLQLENMPKNARNIALKWYFEKRMEAMYGKAWLASLLIIYFKGESEDFPLFKQLKDYYHGNISEGLGFH